MPYFDLVIGALGSKTSFMSSMLNQANLHHVIH